VSLSEIKQDLAGASARMPSAAPTLLSPLAQLCAAWSSKSALAWLRSVAESGNYLVPPDRLASGDTERLKRSAHDLARSYARATILSLVVDPGFDEVLAVEGALLIMLTEIDAELEWRLAEDLDEFGDEGVDMRAEIDTLLGRRAAIIRALERSRGGPAGSD